MTFTTLDLFLSDNPSILLVTVTISSFILLSSSSLFDSSADKRFLISLSAFSLSVFSVLIASVLASVSEVINSFILVSSSSLLFASAFISSTIDVFPLVIEEVTSPIIFFISSSLAILSSLSLVIRALIASSLSAVDCLKLEIISFISLSPLSLPAVSAANSSFMELSSFSLSSVSFAINSAIVVFPLVTEDDKSPIIPLISSSALFLFFVSASSIVSKPWSAFFLSEISLSIFPLIKGILSSSSLIPLIFIPSFDTVR